MYQPPGYKDGTCKALQLCKALYGLKQGGRNWNIYFNRIMVNKLGFQWLNFDPCIYLWQDKHGLTIVGVHIDNMIALADTTGLMDSFTTGLAKHVKITDLSMPSLFLGIEILHNHSSCMLSICQYQYILRVLKHFSMADANPISTPLNPNVKLVKTPDNADLSEMGDVLYQAAIGSLMYAALGTWPDISYAVQVLSQYSSRPGPDHWTVVKQVL
uniref:Cytochrome P450 3A13 n=1 Tax=Ganoderma boninense TaxID=34458 RepID=A0A5K1K631_9APHY|nr:Cytochrome P450 3A13 [Ganoderma boninense]